MLQARLLPVPLPSTRREKTASYYKNRNQLALKPSRDAFYRLVMARSQPFNAEEHRLAETFVKELEAATAGTPLAYRAELIASVPRHVVSRYLANEERLAAAIERLDSWASETYEGQRIAAGIGFEVTDASSDIAIMDVWREKFAPVLSNGVDTLLTIGKDGRVGALVLLVAGESSQAPLRMGPVATWASGDRIATILNRNGEILVFSEGRLRFARRNGRWNHYSHEANVLRMVPPKSAVIREAIYESILDVSFARSGACIGVLKSSADVATVSHVLARDDHLATSTTTKARTLRRAIADRPFNAIERQVRMELLALDGATVLDHSGRIVAAGAIVEVSGGSSSGGREAAARRLSKLGLGIKVSADGPVRVFRDDTLLLET